MAKKIELPEWYSAERYDKKLSPEEWLYEIWKRNTFNMDKTELPISIRLLPIEDQKRWFIESVFANDIENFCAGIKAKQAQAIRDLSVADVFRMFFLIAESNWFKTHQDKELIQGAIHAITSGEIPTPEQHLIFDKFSDIPWHSFHEKTNDEAWYPNKDINYLTGIPVSLNPGYDKNDSSKQLKSALTSWVGKLHDIEKKFDLWGGCKMLAVFDLATWFNLQGVKYSKIDIHKLLWPHGRISSIKEKRSADDSLVNPYDDIDQIFDLINRDISLNVIRTLIHICENRKFHRNISS